ncbi:MAG TPA: protein-tyrosine phosphatase family protein, partial [bacterium]
GLHFQVFPIPDRGIPSSRRNTLDFLRKLEKAPGDGMRVLIHCRQGIGRSALMAASLLVITGVDPEGAFQRVGAARGVTVPETAEQRNWLTDFSRELVTNRTKHQVRT